MAKIYRFGFDAHFTSGALIRNGLHYVTQVGEFGSEPNAHDLLVGLDDRLTAHYLGVLHNSCHLESVTLTEVLPPSDPTGIPEAAQIAKGDAGVLSAGGSKVPEALCTIMGLKTGVARRWARGYMALPSPVSETYLDDGGALSATYKANAAALAAVLTDVLELGAINPTNVLPIVYSRTQAILGSEQPWAQVTSAGLRLKPSWRKSRETVP